MFITQDVWNIPTFDVLSDDLLLRMNISVSERNVICSAVFEIK